MDAVVNASAFSELTPGNSVVKQLTWPEKGNATARSKKRVAQTESYLDTQACCRSADKPSGTRKLGKR